ncbi:MAG: DUF721 domain-containing protein [Gammaproteobacteria bacterium]|nr:DUF721 domain-containing protein [Gammaproteobacteria bacterium]MBU1415678.1 DUF721 domain-containing protein [Gammaproteobacteria bacterium]
MPQPRGYSRSLEHYLAADPSLARLSAHARKLLRLQRAFESVTPLARQSRVANFRQGKVIIHAVNGAAATKLRQLEPRLLAAFQHAGGEVTGISVRLQPATGGPSQAQRELSAPIGPNQKRALTSLAEGLPEESSLRTALQHLIDRAK